MNIIKNNIIFTIMGRIKQLYEEIYVEELEKHYLQLYMEEKLYSERYGGDMELIDVEKCEDSGMGDDQHQNLSRKR